MVTKAELRGHSGYSICGLKVPNDYETDQFVIDPSGAEAAPFWENYSATSMIKVITCDLFSNLF